MITIAFRFEFGLSEIVTLVLLLVLAVIFGRTFDKTVESRQKRSNGEYTAIWVAVGCGVTILIVAMMAAILTNDVAVGLAALLVQGGAFAATGVPMILGSIRRHEERISSDAARMRALAEEKIDAA